MLELFTEIELNKPKTKFALTCSCQQVIRMLAFRGRNKFDVSFHLKIPGIGEAAV